MSDAVRQVAQTFHVVVGFEEVITPPYDKLVTVNLSRTTVTDALNAIIRTDPRYEWRQVSDGAYRVFKKDAAGDLPDLVVKSFTVKDRSWQEISNLLDKMPEIATWLGDRHCSLGGAIIAGPDVSQEDGKKISINANGKHFSEILDEIAEEAGMYFGSVVQFGQGTCRVGVRIN
jgi:hypothetical protein